MHTITVCCLLVLFHSWLSIEQSLIHPEWAAYGSVSHSLPVSKLSDLFAVCIALLVLNVIVSGLDRNQLRGCCVVWRVVLLGRIL